MNDGKYGGDWNRRLTGIEAFAHTLPILALLVPILLVILVPKNEFTRAIFGGWNAVIFVAAIFAGAVWWSNRLLRSKADNQDHDS